MLFHSKTCCVVGASESLAKTCCVVGASESLERVGCGEEIDAHDHVIRANCHPIIGFEKDVGTKSTIMCHHKIPNKEQFTRWHQAPNIAEFWFYRSKYRMISETLSIKSIQKYFKRRKLIGAAYMLKHWPNLNSYVFGLPPWSTCDPNVVHYVSAGRLLKIRREFDCEIKYAKQQPSFSDIILPGRPTTGMMAITTAIYKGWNVSIVGFGKRDTNRNVNHIKSYDTERKPMPPCDHDYEQERLLLNGLESKGLLKRLDG